MEAPLTPADTLMMPASILTDAATTLGVVHQTLSRHQWPH